MTSGQEAHWVYSKKPSVHSVYSKQHTWTMHT